MKDIRVVSLIQGKDIANKLKNMVDQLQRCQKALNEFLEEKRAAFARFYFIGDDDMLEILGQATNPLVIQTHLKKLFAGIHTVKFDDKNEYIVAMKSLEGEHVPLTNKVKISHNVEVRICRDSADIGICLQLNTCLFSLSIHNQFISENY